MLFRSPWLQRFVIRVPIDFLSTSTSLTIYFWSHWTSYSIWMGFFFFLFVAPVSINSRNNWAWKSWDIFRFGNVTSSCKLFAFNANLVFALSLSVYGQKTKVCTPSLVKRQRRSHLLRLVGCCIAIIITTDNMKSAPRDLEGFACIVPFLMWYKGFLISFSCTVTPAHCL